MKECPACKYCFPDDFNNCPTDGQRLKLSIEGDTVLDGRYQLDRRLGHGGMGIVFQARHILLKSTFAIKVILPELVGNDPMLVTRFRQEAMVAAQLHHPNLVNVTDFGVVRGMPYLVMELIHGKSLHDLLSREGRLSPRRSLQIMTGVVAGVGAAHREGVVHRDLKPLNIMLTTGMASDQGIKVLDFGLAKIKSGELLGSFVGAQTTALMGSPAYMAPELWSDDEPDARTDVYSLGVILFQILSGQVPFRGSTVPSVMKKHLTEPPPSFAEEGVMVPPEIERVVRRALAKHRDDRYSSVEAYLEDFRHAVDSMSTAFAATQIGFEIGADARTMQLPELSVEQKTLAERQRSIEHEAERLALEFKEAQRRADEARERAEEAARRRLEEETARKRAEEEAARKLAEEEEARRRAEEAARKLVEEEAARLRAEEEAERQRLADEARKRAEEQAERKRVAEEAARLAREIAEMQRRAEEARLRADEEARKRTEEQAARKRAEEEARKLAAEVAEAKLRAEEARQRAEEEAGRRALEKAELLKAEEKAARERAEEELRKRTEEEATRKRAASEVEHLAQEVAEAQNRAEEAGKRAEEESLKRAAEEAARRKAEEEARRLAIEVEEAQRRVEEARKRVDEARAQAAAEAEERRRQDELAAVNRSMSEQTIAQSASPFSGREATVASIPPFETPPAGEPDQLATMRVSAASIPPQTSQSGPLTFDQNSFSGASAEIVQQSHPSLPPSSQTQPVHLASLSNIATGTRSRTVGMIVGGLVLLIIVGGGAALAIRSWLSPRTEPAQPVAAGASASAPITATTSTSPQLIEIKGGSFQMGRSDIDLKSREGYDLNQYPAHPVSVTNFYMDRTEVTNAEYAEFVNETKHPAPSYWNGGKPPAGQEKWPVTNVSLADANAFAGWRSKRDGVKYLLPTEEQWEYVARNGSQATLYPWGNQWLDDRANAGTNSPRPVGSFPEGKSREGVVDLIGNVWEWTSSKAVSYPGNTELKLPQGQVIRGGSYLEPSSGSDAITATRRSVVQPSTKDATIGFRLIRGGP